MKILLSEEQLRDGVAQLAAQLRRRYAEQELTIVGVMTGSLMLVADLVRRLNIPVRIGMIYASSYRGGVQRGSLSISSEWLPDVADRHVLVADDILDSGHTLQEVLARVRDLRPASVASAVLLRKQGKQEVAIEPDYAVFEIPDEFVVGYGLDYDDDYRHLPYIAALEASDLSGKP